MARTARKTSAATVAATEAAADTEARSIGDIAAEVVAALPTPENSAEAGHGAQIFIPLNKLKKSPRNARKIPHSEAHIEALAASIAAKGMLQNLIVEPELDADSQPTGFYYVTVGEGRRLAHLLRAKRKEIGKAEPIRCVLDSVNDPQEISLDENVTREAMHPADQFEAFRELAEQYGWGAEDIAARFGVTAHVVRQRLRLDHHLPDKNSKPSIGERGVFYAAGAGTPGALAVCLAEVFQETRIVDSRDRAPWFVVFRTTRTLRLLDLRGLWPTRADASSTIASGSKARARRWSRAIYETYPDIDGLIYPSSMGGNTDAYALLERAQTALPSTPDFHRALADPAMDGPLLAATAAINFGLL